MPMKSGKPVQTGQAVDTYAIDAILLRNLSAEKASAVIVIARGNVKEGKFIEVDRSQYRVNDQELAALMTAKTLDGETHYEAIKRAAYSWAQGAKYIPADASDI